MGYKDSFSSQIALKGDIYVVLSQKRGFYIGGLLVFIGSFLKVTLSVCEIVCLNAVVDNNKIIQQEKRQRHTEIKLVNW